MNRGCKSCWPRILHRGGREGGGGETCVSLVVPDIKCGVIILLFVCRGSRVCVWGDHIYLSEARLK